MDALLRAAKVLAADRGHQVVEPIHLLAAMVDLRDSPVAAVLVALEVDRSVLLRELPAARTGAASTPVALSRRAASLLESKAAEEARARGEKAIAPEHVLLAVLEENEVQIALARTGVRPDTVRHTLESVFLVDGPRPVRYRKPGVEGMIPLDEVVVDDAARRLLAMLAAGSHHVELRRGKRRARDGGVSDWFECKVTGPHRVGTAGAPSLTLATEALVSLTNPPSPDELGRFEGES